MSSQAPAPDAAPSRARYGVYFVPQGRLYMQGSRLLGYDLRAGTSVPQPDLSDVSVEELERWTQAPRRYGFHGTLKAPFHLKPGVTEGALLEAAEALAGRLEAVDTTLWLRPLNGFLTLRPHTREDELCALAFRCVTELDGLRHHDTAALAEKYPTLRLTEPQAENVTQWGYPFVGEEYRFHLTLSEPLPMATRDRLADALAEYFAERLLLGFQVNTLAVVRQEEPPLGPFHLVSEYPLLCD